MATAIQNLTIEEIASDDRDPVLRNLRITLAYTTCRSSWLRGPVETSSTGAQWRAGRPSRWGRISAAKSSRPS